MKIGLYFGSFNPVHVGHLIIANFVVSAGTLNQLWFVITPQNPFKLKKDLLNEYHRQYLIQSAIEGENKLRCSTIEFHLPKPSYTIDTLIYLEEKYPEHNFSIVIGSDSFKNIGKWKNNDILIKKYPFIIYANIEVLNAPLLEISSTNIRDRIRHGKSIRFFVPDVVNEEIIKNRYYKNMPA